MPKIAIILFTRIIIPFVVNHFPLAATIHASINFRFIFIYLFLRNCLHFVFHLRQLYFTFSRFQPDTFFHTLSNHLPFLLSPFAYYLCQSYSFNSRGNPDFCGSPLQRVRVLLIYGESQVAIKVILSESNPLKSHKRGRGYTYLRYTISSFLSCDVIALGSFIEPQPTLKHKRVTLDPYRKLQLSPIALLRFLSNLLH